MSVLLKLKAGHGGDKNDSKTLFAKGWVRNLQHLNRVSNTYFYELLGGFAGAIKETASSNISKIVILSQERLSHPTELF